MPREAEKGGIGWKGRERSRQGSEYGGVNPGIYADDNDLEEGQGLMGWKEGITRSKALGK